MNEQQLASSGLVWSGCQVRLFSDVVCAESALSMNANCEGIKRATKFNVLRHCCRRFHALICLVWRQVLQGFLAEHLGCVVES